ncbi:hypothetical protein FOXYS1_5645 [Fusarium oxysporum]|uniref:Uncharacterized protein n=2 Tax=Fusarium oxysporum TaxID=5507 RepID=A0A8H5AF52_FUSOX|nr:hypothetical protein FOXYS1_5645 [Fusarium oxysporum]
MNPIGVPIPFPDDAMPPEGQYSSREELVTAINAWAAPRGYAFSVKSSVVTPSGRTRVIYSCDRGAGKAPKVKPAKERKRKTTTRRTGCQFSIAAKESLYTLATQQDIYNYIAQGQEKWDTFYKHWHEIVASTTEDIYMERLEKFKQQYSPDHLNEAWVHQHRHFQQFVTSRAEGIHRLIKSHMKTSQVDLFGAWNIIKLVLSNQLKRLEEVQSQQQASTPIDISGPLYSNIRGWLSHEALRQLDNQRQRLLREYPACTGVTARTLGLPCAHMLQPLIQLDEPLLLEQIHPHWLLHRPGTPRIIIEPHKLFNRLAASSKLPPTSTQREPCAFEAIEKETSQKAPPKCSKCGTVGHTSRSKHPRHHSHTTTRRVSPPAPTPLAAAPALRADDPRAIYQRYKEAREAWYATVPRGGLRTNQQYRKAMGLPARYSKIELQWCLNYKQMGPRCREKSGTREWTKEEQFSYLDWDKAENERVEQNVGEEMAEKPFPQRRGMQHIWDAAERDVLQQGGGA